MEQSEKDDFSITGVSRSELLKAKQYTELMTNMIDANGTVAVKLPPDYAFQAGFTQGGVATTHEPGFGGSSLSTPYSNMIVGNIGMPPPQLSPLSTGGGAALFITGTHTHMPVAYTMQGRPPSQAMLRCGPTRMDEALDVSADVHRLYLGSVLAMIFCNPCCGIAALVYAMRARIGIESVLFGGQQKLDVALQPAACGRKWAYTSLTFGILGLVACTIYIICSLVTMTRYRY